MSRFRFDVLGYAVLLVLLLVPFGEAQPDCLHNPRGCALDASQPGQGVLAAPEEVHAWRISLTSVSDVTVVLSNLQVEYDLHVIGPDGSAMYDSSRYGADDDSATLSAAGPGDYTIYVNSPFGDISDTPYALQVSVNAIGATSAPPTATPTAFLPPNQGTCYRFTSTPIGGATYAMTMRFASSPAATVTYWNPPTNTWFYAKYVSGAQQAQPPTVTISVNGADVQTVQAADSLIDLSNGASQSFVNFHYIDSLLDTAVSLTGPADVIKSPVLGTNLPPLSTFTRTRFFYKPAGTGRVAAISTC